jgi:phenylpyruvate tautomerase PptA (4-oxalocrotonate tautomerase family)
MPLVNITVPKGKSKAFRQAISDGVHAALQEEFGVPKDDLFQIVAERDPQAEIVHAPGYLGLEYSNDLTILQLTVSDTRTVDQKKRLFANIAKRLSESPGLRPDDVFINLVEVKKENWSFGRGLAQYA